MKHFSVKQKPVSHKKMTVTCPSNLVLMKDKFHIHLLFYMQLAQESRIFFKSVRLKRMQRKRIMTAVTFCWRKATGNVVAMELSANCTGHRKKVEVYAANFFTNGSFLQTLDNGFFSWCTSLEVLSGDVNKTVLLDTTYCHTQRQRGFSLKADSVITLCITCPEKEEISF